MADIPLCIIELIGMHITMEVSSVKINRARYVAGISQCIGDLSGMHIAMEASSFKINRARYVADTWRIYLCASLS